MIRSNSCQECSPVKPEDLNLKPTLSICYSSDSYIFVGKDTIRALGNPEYITMLVNWDVPSVAIMECQPGDNMSFKVPSLSAKKYRFRIYAKPFIRRLAESSGNSFLKAVMFKGVYNLEKKAVIFDLSDEKDSDIVNLPKMARIQGIPDDNCEKKTREKR